MFDSKRRSINYLNFERSNDANLDSNSIPDINTLVENLLVELSCIEIWFCYLICLKL